MIDTSVTPLQQPSHQAPSGAAATCLSSAYGAINLRRPQSGAQGLRAWDAADELLLSSLATGTYLTPDSEVAVLEDGFGALALSLQAANHQCHSFGDLATAALGLRDNALLNQMPAPQWSAINAPVAQRFPLIVMKIPRHRRYLQALLHWCGQSLAEDGLLIAGGMLKHLPDQCAEIFSASCDQVEVLPAWRKARVVVARVNAEKARPVPWRGYPLDLLGGRIEAAPGVFCGDQLDQGSRLLLPFLPEHLGSAHVLDLGCGNGLLGLVLAKRNPQIQIDFYDVSALALASTKRNWQQFFGERPANFVHADVLHAAHGQPAPAQLDLVVCNPPFHEGGAVTDHIAWRMFGQARQLLKPGGRLLIVGNRHLGYHVKLKQGFGRVVQLGGDKRFVVLEAIKR